jgi:hypothetical protein
MAERVGFEPTQTPIEISKFMKNRRLRVPSRPLRPAFGSRSTGVPHLNPSTVFLRFLSAVEHAIHDARLAVDLVIHGVGKASDEQPMAVEYLRVNAGVEFQGVDIGNEGVKKIIAEASSLPSIESAPAVEILERPSAVS